METILVEKFVHPGEMEFGDRDTRIMTILGSCVAIVAWHPVRMIGGMSHYMLPGRRTKPRNDLNGRYSEDALELLARKFIQFGITLAECRIKLFGGGNMFPPSVNGMYGPVQIGRDNIQAASRLMQRHNLHPVFKHMGGDGHRRLRFEVASGEVWMHYHPLRMSA